MGNVGILIFVHEDIAKPRLVLAQHIGIFLENRDHMQQNIAKIDSIQVDQTALIGGVKIDTLAIERPAFGDRHLVGRQRLVLPAIDDPRQHPRRPAFFVDIRGHDQLLEQTQLVIGIKDRETRLQPHQFGMTPQQFGTD